MEPLKNQTMTPIIELQNVRKTYRPDAFKKATVAVDNLSCTLNEGECIGLLGHNGAGKTTTIRMMLGLTKPDKGKVLFRDKKMNFKHLRHIGYMPEINVIPGELNCEEVLKIRLGLMGMRLSSQIHAHLDRIGLGGAKQKKIKELSKGMARKLAWLQAIIHNPQVLILDEPFSGLDPYSRILMQNWLKQERQKKKAIVICTHELWSVEHLCDRLIFLKQGKTLANDQYKSLEEKPVYHILEVSYEAEIEKLFTHFAQAQIAKPALHFSKGYLRQFYFENYADAEKALQECLKQRIFIVRFFSGFELPEQDLQRLFDQAV